MSLEKGSLDALRAAAHPVRLRIMSLLTGNPLSAAEVARELGMTHANASYHLRVLERAGEIVVVETEQVRGGTAKRYGYREVGGAPRGSLGSAQALIEAFAHELRRRAPHHAEGTPAHFSDLETWLPQDEAAAILAELAALSTRAHNAARPPRTPGCVPVSYTVLMFPETPPDDTAATTEDPR